MTDPRPDPRIHELAPFLAAVCDAPEDLAPRLVMCDRLDELGHPVARAARLVAEGQRDGRIVPATAGLFVRQFAYACLREPGQTSVTTCPLTDAWWPVVVFLGPTTPVRVLVTAGGGADLELRWAEAPAGPVSRFGLPPGAAPGLPAEMPLPAMRAINGGVLMLLARGPAGAALTLRVVT